MVELGYRIEPLHRRRGYARQALETLLAVADASANVNIVRATISPENHASRSLVDGRGFKAVDESLRSLMRLNKSCETRQVLRDRNSAPHLMIIVMTTLQEMTARQQPIDTAFGYRTTAAEVINGIDLAGKTAVVTGGYSGLGLETVKALTAAGVTVIVPARRPEKAAEALAGVEGVRVAPMDLGDLDSVAAFTASMSKAATPIDIMINAAGVMATPEQRTAQGWEIQFGTNYLGHFALVAGIHSLLREGARIVSYSSTGHWRSPVLFDDINFDSAPYDPWVAYGQSKTADALLAVALDSRGATRGIHAFSVHPGGIMTDLQRNMPQEELLARQWIDEDGIPNPLFKTAAEGASTGLWAATAPELVDRGGVYCEDCSIKGIVSADHTDYSIGGPKEWAIDPDAAEKLWAISVAATKLDPFSD